MEFSTNEIETILAKHQDGGSNALMAILGEVQDCHRYLPRDVLILISERLAIPLSQVYSVATFYNAFSLERRGRHEIRVCLGTACHVRGAPRVLTQLEDSLGIEPGETTSDWRYSLDTVYCLGACALGPIVVVDGEYSGQMNPKKVDQLLTQIEQLETTEA